MGLNGGGGCITGPGFFICLTPRPQGNGAGVDTRVLLGRVRTAVGCPHHTMVHHVTLSASCVHPVCYLSPPAPPPPGTSQALLGGARGSSGSSLGSAAVPGAAMATTATSSDPDTLQAELRSQHASIALMDAATLRVELAKALVDKRQLLHALDTTASVHDARFHAQDAQHTANVRVLHARLSEFRQRLGESAMVIEWYERQSTAPRSVGGGGGGGGGGGEASASYPMAVPSSGLTLPDGSAVEGAPWPLYQRRGVGSGREWPQSSESSAEEGRGYRGSGYTGGGGNVGGGDGGNASGAEGGSRAKAQRLVQQWATQAQPGGSGAPSSSGARRPAARDRGQDRSRHSTSSGRGSRGGLPAEWQGGSGGGSAAAGPAAATGGAVLHHVRPAPRKDALLGALEGLAQLSRGCLDDDTDE